MKLRILMKLFHHPAVLLLKTATLLGAAVTVAGAEQQHLSGHVPSAVRRLQSTGRLPASKRLDFIIGLPLRDKPALTNLLENLYDPASTNFHRYLSPSQFAERFGPAEKDYQRVLGFAATNGLTVTGTHS